MTPTAARPVRAVSTFDPAAPLDEQVEAIAASVEALTGRPADRDRIRVRLEAEAQPETGA